MVCLILITDSLKQKESQFLDSLNSLNLTFFYLRNLGREQPFLVFAFKAII